MLGARVPKRRRRGAGLAAVVALVGALALPGGAAAETVTVGAPMTQLDSVTLSFAHPTTLAVPAPGEPALANELTADFVSPVDGVVRRWRLAAQQNPGGLYALRVLRPTGDGSYTAVATSQGVAANNAFALTFTTALPIQAGDLIGLDLLAGSPTPSVAVAPLTGAQTVAWYEPDLLDGTTRAPDRELERAQPTFNADVEAAPRVILMAPTTGPSTGGTTVQISGRNFGGVTGVFFGRVPATGFVVNSQEELTVTAPPSPAIGPVDVTVTSAAGTSRVAAGGEFTYTAPPAAPVPPAPAPTAPAAVAPAPGCVVPVLIGDDLLQARRDLVGAGCRLGRVTGLRRQTARVVRQSPTPGAVRPRHAAVNVRLVRTAPPRR